MKNAKPILVVGATGVLGLQICKQLSAENKSVRGLVRSSSDPSKVESLKEMGVDTVIGDIKDRSSIDVAMVGIGAVISTASSTLSHAEGDNIESVDRLGQINVIDAASSAGVEKFVFISFSESPETFPLQDAKRAAEEHLIKTAMNYTILRPTVFMEIWLSPAIGFDYQNHKATVYGDGKNKISWIAVQDVAAFAIASLENPAATNVTIDLGGPEALSPLEVISLFEQQSQPFELVLVPEAALRDQKNQSIDPLQQSFAALMLTLARGGEIDMHEKFKKFSVQPTTVLTYCKKVTEEVVA